MLNSKKKSDKDKELRGEAEENEAKKAATEKEGAEAAKSVEPASGEGEAEDAQKALLEEKDRYLRLHAEFQNFKKRVEKEKVDLVKYGNEKLLTDLLQVLDNIDRAVKSSEDTQDTRLRDGILLIKKAFDDVLAANGVEEVAAQNAAFNHDEHYAVMTEEAEGVAEGMVLDVLQKGYKLNGKVIRPSMVKVSK